MVVVLPGPESCQRPELLDDPSDEHRDVATPCLGETQLDVLGHQLEPEAGRKGSGEDLAWELVRGGGVATASRVEDLEEQRRVEPRLDADRQGLRGDRHRGRREQVVEELRSLSLSRVRANPEDVRAERLEQGTHALERLSVAGGHHREASRLEPGNASAHRGIDVHDVCLMESGGDLLARGGTGGREVDERPHGLATGDPISSARDVAYHVRGGKARQHGLGDVGDRHGRPERDGSPLDERRHRLGPLVEHHQVRATLEQRSGHAPTHRPQADEADRPNLAHATPPSS